MDIRVSIFSVGFLIIQGVAMETLCPDSWVPFKGSCYWFAFDQRMPYDAAQHFCMHHGAFLTHVNNALESNFLRNLLSNFIPSQWWIGLDDRQKEGEFKWIDSDTPVEYTDWAKGSPHSPNASLHYDCVFVQHLQNYRWMDVGCSAHFQPICQKTGSNNEPTVG